MMSTVSTSPLVRVGIVVLVEKSLKVLKLMSSVSTYFAGIICLVVCESIGVIQGGIIEDVKKVLEAHKK